MDMSEVMRVVPSPNDQPTYSTSDAYHKAMVLDLIQQLDLCFYTICYLTYLLDGKTVIFSLRMVSQVQFSQPKQIQPDRSLRFFAVLSLTISILTLIHHLCVPTTPSGAFLDFIGPSRTHHWNPGLQTLALVGLDCLSCSAQLLLVLLTFTQSHQIPLQSVLLFPPISTPTFRLRHQSPLNSPTTATAATGDPEHEDLLEEGHLHSDHEESVSSLFTLDLRYFFTILLTVQVPSSSSPSSLSSPIINNLDEQTIVTTPH